MVVVDDLDEGLDAAALLDGLLTHAAGDLEGVALDTGDDGVREGVSLGARVLRLDNDNLLIAKKKQPWSAHPRRHKNSQFPLNLFQMSRIRFKILRPTRPQFLLDSGFCPPPAQCDISCNKGDAKGRVVPSYRRNGHG